MNRPQLIFILVLCLFTLTPLNAFGQTCEPGTLQPPIVSTGPGYNQLTITVTGTQGSSGTYIVYGAPQGDSNYQEGTWHFPSPGYTSTVTTSHYGQGYSLETFKTYSFYVATRICGVWTVSGTSNGTTLDIDAPA